MFKPKAPHPTTHVLARDYARRTIDIALIHHSDLLTDDERKYITPPFTEGGIREWGESRDRDVGLYRDGNAPLGMDFANYTLGSLVKDRSNYDFEHDEYKRVRSNIFWRIYDLGYSLDSFGEIDRGIAGRNLPYRRSADGYKTDRYGKKYSWIAFYELAGLRQDKSLLSEYYDDLRISDADIDPSFPIEQREYNLVKENFLGDQRMSTEEWIFKSDLPDVTPYLKVDQLCEEEGPWVLLDGSLEQKDNQVDRQMFTFLQGLIVTSEESEEIVERLRQNKIYAGRIPPCPEDSYTYAGEIPWCDTYPANGWEELSFEIGSVMVPREQRVLLRNGELISEEETYDFFDSVGLIGIEDEETIEARLREQGLESSIEMVKVEEPKYKTFKILFPIRKNGWEDHRSAIVDSRSVATPSRQIADTLSLCGQPQSFDLFEKDGRRASITFGLGEGWGEMQKFTYLRKDLLERYLSEINGELIWVIWGERHPVSQNKNTPYKRFREIRVYPHSHRTSRNQR